MPSTYAHYRFGQEVLKQVSSPVREVIQQYPDLYNIGLHGPDLLFYYNALTKNHVNSCGFGLHKYPGKFFFERAGRVIREKDMDPACLAYIYGYLCHFSLDVSCHGFVEGQIARTGIGHLAIEAELDRRFMTMDGKNASTFKPTGHLIQTMESAEVIQNFYPEISAKEAYKSIGDMVFYLNLLVPSSPVKRMLLVNSVKLVGKYDSIGGLIMSKKELPEGRESVDRLVQLYEDGKELAVRLIEGYGSWLKGEGQLDEIYDLNFDSRKVHSDTNKPNGD